MKIRLSLAPDLRSQSVVQQRWIPCRLEIGTIGNLLRFPDVLNGTAAEIVEYDRERLEQRAYSLGGGDYAFLNPALVTLDNLGDSIFKVAELRLFYEMKGWITVWDRTT